MPGETTGEIAALRAQIREMECQIEEYEDTLGAIRRGEIDAVVVKDSVGEHRIYTLESADRPYRVLVEQMQEGAVTLREDGTVLYCNRRLAGMLGVAHERVVGQTLQQFLVAENVALFERLLSDAKHCVARGEFTFRAAIGPEIPVYVSLNVLQDDDLTLMCGVLTDLTEQKTHLAEVAEANARLLNEIAERERAEDALRQAQKMEAIGQLTGGIAHDFNNMLQGITAGITLAHQRMKAGRTEQAGSLLDAALNAANRAATLTQRLLGFGRRQALDPKLVALDELIGGMQGLLQQTVGPSARLELRLQEECWPVRCDPNQLENALLNLVINARDALPAGGGVIGIDTAHVELGNAETANWEGAVPGEYVCITVSDDGTGMPPDVLAHAFEPFFTTKPDGQGTGLGLSQIYGFVRQSHGMVRLDSALGTGTSVHLYLPRGHAVPSDEALVEAPESGPAPAKTAGPVTVLLVEDEPTIRGLAAEALRELGYRIIEAVDGPAGLKALQQAVRPPGPVRINLLVTDVGLPGGLNGRQLADAARALAPHLPVLLITGYGGDVITGQDLLGPEMAILSKPFTLEALARKVQRMVESAKTP